jgi:lipopolysaccharide export system protein LptC
MAGGADNRYSIFIGWAKIVLPLAALGLLSTIFLFSRQADEGAAVSFSEIAAIAREPRISNPTLAGLADDGSVISLRAVEIRPMPDTADGFAVTGVRLGVTAPDGSEFQISAGSGQVDAAAQTARFTDLVRLTSSTGYAMETTGARADLRTGTIETEGPLAVQAPFGRIDAGKLVIAADPEGSGTRLLFQDGVRLLYEPQT